MAEYEKAVQLAFREVADALVARDLLNQQLEAQAAVAAAEADRLKLSDARFQNGVSSSLDVLDAQRQLFTAEQALVQTRLLRLTNAIDLYRSLGGGLKVGAVVPAISVAPVAKTQPVVNAASNNAIKAVDKSVSQPADKNVSKLAGENASADTSAGVGASSEVVQKK